MAIISPMLYLSLNTPFALIDDYTDWMVIGASFNSILQNHVAHLFELNIYRTRPMFELVNYLTWSIFGDQPWAHHLFRWILKGITFAFIFFSIKSIFSRLVNHHYQKNYFSIIFFLPLFIWFLFPNSPDARLAPVELLLSLFLALLIFSAIKIIYSLSSSDNYNFALILLYTGAIGVIGSKETGFAYALIAIASIIFTTIFIKKNQFSLYLKLAPILLFILWSGYSTYFKLVNDATPYGKSGLAAIKANALGFYKATALIDINPVLQLFIVCPIAYCIYYCVKYFFDNRKGFFTNENKILYFATFILIVGELLVAILMALLSPLVCIRYIFPLLVPYTIAISLLGAVFFSIQERSKKIKVLVVIASFWVLFCTYGATVSQYGIQYSERNAEKLFLADALLIARENEGRISIHSRVGEFKDKAIKYLTLYRQTFYKDFSVIADGGEMGAGKINAYRVSSDIPENPGILISHNSYKDSNITLLSIKFSKIFGASGNVRFDCGSSDESDWKIFKK